VVAGPDDDDDGGADRLGDSCRLSADGGPERTGIFDMTPPRLMAGPGAGDGLSGRGDADRSVECLGVVGPGGDGYVVWEEENLVYTRDAIEKSMTL
jgi:hypothetical protein